MAEDLDALKAIAAQHNVANTKLRGGALEEEGGADAAEGRRRKSKRARAREPTTERVAAAVCR